MDFDLTKEAIPEFNSQKMYLYDIESAPRPLLKEPLMKTYNR